MLKRFFKGEFTKHVNVKPSSIGKDYAINVSNISCKSN